MENKICKILLVEDDKALRFIIKDNLEQNNFDVDIAEDGEKALEIFSMNDHAIIILDIMLPKRDGFSVAKEIRKKDEMTPILFLTARSMTEDKIKGLTIGGDDYITKPFSMEELLLKISIFLKRREVFPQNNITQIVKEVQIGKFNFIPNDLSLIFNSNRKKLTLKEAELIGLFAENRNKVLSRTEILNQVWGSDDYFLGRRLEVFISRLRKYFKSDPDIKIINIHGIGFRFSIEDNSYNLK
jgi:DNA-binding response OmpR family regulator